MRKDMFKVIVERPRLGGHDNVPVRARLKGKDEMPSRIGMRKHAALVRDETKMLNENLKPLRRYLRRQIGRPWNKVYSEICATLDSGHTVKAHVRQHIEDFVAAKIVVLRDGRWMSGGTRRFFGNDTVWRQPFYVDPRDGILKDSAKYWQKAGYGPTRWKYRPKVDPNLRQLDGTRELRKIDGVWYEIGYNRNVREAEKHWDYPWERIVKEASEGNWVYDLLKRGYVPARLRHAVAKRQLSGPELKAHGLANEIQD